MNLVIVFFLGDRGQPTGGQLWGSHGVLQALTVFGRRPNKSILLLLFFFSLSFYYSVYLSFLPLLFFLTSLYIYSFSLFLHYLSFSLLSFLFSSFPLLAHLLSLSLSSFPFHFPFIFLLNFFRLILSP